MTDKNDKPYVNFVVLGSVEEYVTSSGKFRTECSSFQIPGRDKGVSGALYIPYCDKQRFDFGSFLNDCRGFGGFTPPQIGKPIAPTDFALFRQQFHDIHCPQACPGYSPRKRRISEITRRDIVDALLLDKSAPFHGRLDLVSFLKRIWPLTSMPSTDSRFKDAEGDIWQHMVNNSDWDESELLYRRLDIVEIPDERFASFLETCAHPLVIPDAERINKLVALFNDALKNDGFAMRPSGQLSGRPIFKVVSITGAAGFGHEYEVVLSFAGEDRTYVERVADILRARGVSLFYDNYEEATLWGKDLVEHLHKVYSGSARFCVMFISKHYADKVWPTHERRSAFEKAIETKEEYILPARFDETEIPGLRKTVHYVDLRRKSPEQLAALILEKLGRPQFSDDSTESKTDNENIPF